MRSVRECAYMRPSGKSSLTPAPPCTWIARSMTSQRDPRRDHLDGGDLGARRLGADVVDQPGGLEGQQPRLLDRHPRLGDLLAHHALLGERLAEGDARRGALAHQLERPLRHADRAHAVMDAAGPEPAWAIAKPPPSSPIRLLDRHADVGRSATSQWPCWSLVAEDRQVADDLDARGVHRHEDHRLLAVRSARRVGLAHHDEDLAARVGGAARPPLAAVDDVVVAVAGDRASRCWSRPMTRRPARSSRTPSGSRRPAAAAATAPSAPPCRTCAAPPCCRCPAPRS